MLSNSELEHLLSAMRLSQVTTLDFKTKEQRLRLVLPSFVSLLTSTPTPLIEEQELVLTKYERVCATSPTIGTFLLRGIDDGLALLESGMRVEKGEILGYVCHGSVRVIVEAPGSGVLIDKGPEDGAILGLGDIVFNLEVTS